MKTLNKGFAPIVLVIIIVALLSVGGVVYYKKIKPETYAGIENTEQINQTLNEQNAQNIAVIDPKLKSNIEAYMALKYQPKTEFLTTTCSSLVYGVGDGYAYAWVYCGTYEKSLALSTASSVGVRLKYNSSYKIISHDEVSECCGNEARDLQVFPGKYYQLLVKGHPTNEQSQALAAEALNKAKVFFNVSASTQTNQQSSTMNIKVYFYNTISDPGLLDCRINYSVNRTIPQTSAVARASLEKLFAGPTAAESTAGYGSFIQQGVVINSLTITNGVAHLDISKEPSTGGSCGVTGSSMQIKNTLLQFPTIQSYELTVNGQVLPNDI